MHFIKILKFFERSFGAKRMFVFFLLSVYTCKSLYSSYTHIYIYSQVSISHFTWYGLKYSWNIIFYCLFLSLKVKKPLHIRYNFPLKRGNASKQRSSPLPILSWILLLLKFFLTTLLLSIAFHLQATCTLGKCFSQPIASAALQIIKIHKMSKKKLYLGSYRGCSSCGTWFDSGCWLWWSGCMVWNWCSPGRWFSRVTRCCFCCCRWLLQNIQKQY